MVRLLPAYCLGSRRAGRIKECSHEPRHTPQALHHVYGAVDTFLSAGTSNPVSCPSTPARHAADTSRHDLAFSRGTQSNSSVDCGEHLTALTLASSNSNSSVATLANDATLPACNALEVVVSVDKLRWPAHAIACVTAECVGDGEDL